MRLSMWWDGVWAGRRLDSGVCPIYKHTELDDTGDVNEIKVVTEGIWECYWVDNLNFQTGCLKL